MVVSDSFGELKSVLERILGFSQVFGFHAFKFIGHKALAKGMASSYKASYANHARTYFENVSLSLDFDQLILARKAINKIDVLDDLAQVSCPALVMVGKDFGDFFRSDQ